MGGDRKTLPRVRPTRRQWAILGLYIILLATSLIPLAFFGRGKWMLGVVGVATLLSPWLLGVLVVTLDERGPVRNWAGPLLLALFYPTLAVWYDWSVVASWVRYGVPVNPGFTALLNIVLVGGFGVYAARMLPKRCPACSRRALIPLLRLWQQERRTAKTRWCVACEAKYWKDRQGAWQVERRLTWMEQVPESRAKKKVIRAETPPDQPYRPGIV